MQSKDLPSIIRLQKHIRIANAFKAIEEKCNLNIPTLSKKNLSALQQRLAEYACLPENIKQTIQNEKKRPQDLLTPLELDLYALLLSMPIYLNHASRKSSEIQASGVIHSSASLKAHKISANTHTANWYGQEHYVFFSYGLKPAYPPVINFLQDADVFIVNLDDISKKEPEITEGTWSSGHFYAYDREQTPTPITYWHKEHFTKVQTQYWIAKNPLLHFYRKITFSYPDMTQAVFQLERADEISSGKEIKPWHALRVIEFLRFLHPEIRKYILENQKNPKILYEVYHSIFTPGKAEFHIPWNYKQDWILEKRVTEMKSDSDIALRALIGNDLEKLAECLKSPETAFYRYNFELRHGLTLLNIAVFRNNIPAIHLLMKAGLDPNNTYINKEQQHLFIPASCTALQDAIESNDDALIQALFISTEVVDTLSIRSTTFTNMESMVAAIITRKNESTLKLLLAHFQKLDHSLESLLLLASFYNHVTAIKVLLEHGANINHHSTLHTSSNTFHLIQNTITGTPLTIAAKFGCYKAVEYLLECKADCNQPERHQYSYYKNGNSPLMSAINGFADGKGKFLNKKSKQPYEYYSKNKSTRASYFRIIDALILAGANLSYRDDTNHDLRECIQVCLKNKDVPFLQSVLEKVPTFQPIIEKKIVETSIIITAGSESNDRLLLLGKQDHNETRVLAIPGAEINYTAVNSAFESSIQVTAAQTHLNLQQENLLSRHIYPSVRYKNNYQEVFHFHLPKPHALIEKTPLNHKINYANLMVTPFSSIFWAKIADLELKNVLYQDGKTFPVFYYEGLALPLQYSAKIAALYSDGNVNTVELEQMADYFFKNAKKLTFEAIKSGDLRALENYLKLGLFQNIPLICEKFFYCAFENKQYSIVAWLSKNLALKTIDFREIITKQIQHPHQMIIDLVAASPDSMKYDHNQKVVAEYASQHGLVPLLEKIKDYKNILFQTAIHYQQFQTLAYLQKIEPNYVALGLSHLDNWIFKDGTQLRIEVSQKVIDDFMRLNNAESHLSLCELIRKLLSHVMIHSPLKRHYVELLVMLVNDITKPALPSDFYYRLKETLQHADHEQIVYEAIPKMPVLALLCTESKTKKDRILASNVAHPALQHHCKQPRVFFKRSEAIHRAIEANQLEVIKLLTKDFDKYLNSINRQGQTPLQHALNLHRTEIVDYLVSRGAQIRKHYTLKDAFEHHAHLISTETYLQPVTGPGLKADLYHLPVERIAYGVQHAIRAAIFTKIFVNFYKAMGHPDALNMTEEDIFLLQITTFCHAAKRKSDQHANWKEESADYCEAYLIHIGIDKERAKLFAQAILEQKNNIYGLILGCANCMEIPRLARNFYMNRFPIFEDAPPEYRAVLFILVQEAITWQSQQYDLKHSVNVRLDGNQHVYFAAKATRNPDAPTLKQAYEHHIKPYARCISEIKSFSMLWAYFTNSNMQQPQSSLLNIRWANEMLPCYRKNPLIIFKTKHVFYYYDNLLKAREDLEQFKSTVGTKFPDLLKCASVKHSKEHQNTPYRIRLTNEQHQIIQSVKSSTTVMNRHTLFYKVAPDGMMHDSQKSDMTDKKGNLNFDGI